jgi:hypothetical protein
MVFIKAKSFIQAYMQIEISISKTKLVEQYGIVQKEYVIVPDNLFKKINELKHYFDISYKYVSAMKPKPASKSKKK